MQLQITTDYAVRIISYLYKNRDSLVNAKLMSEQLGITYKYFMKVINHLIEAGFVHSVQGRKGGYYLDETAYDLTVYDLICVMEGEIIVSRCLEKDCFCSRKAEGRCIYRKFLVEAQESIRVIFKNVRIADYIDEM